MSNKEKMLQGAIYGLFKDQQYYGGLIQELNIKYEEDFPTCGISYNKKTREYNIILGTKYFSSLSPEERSAVLKHEILHFSHGHMLRFGEVVDDARIKNIAADMAINQFIRGLPKGCIDYKTWRTKEGAPFPPFKTYEAYYELIKDSAEQNKKLLQKLDAPQAVLDRHQWDNLSEEERIDALKEAKKIFERSIEKTSMSHSSIPEYIKDMLKEIDTSINALNYKSILRNTIKRTVCCADRESTWTRRNKRWGVYAPGNKNGNLPHCAMFIDTSGSISHMEMNEFLQVVSGFLKAGARRCTLGLWHTDLYEISRYKLNEKLDPEKIQSGGTDVTPALRYIEKKTPDLSIILTDGYFELPECKKNLQVLWVISKGGNDDKDFLARLPGRVIRMT